jgi:hypothetical protein
VLGGVVGNPDTSAETSTLGLNGDLVDQGGIGYATWRGCAPFLSGQATTPVGYSIGMELIFEIRDSEEGGFCARAFGHGIFTEADSWDELRANVIEAVSLHFEDATTRPRLVQMHYVKDELIPLEAA